MPRGLAEAEYDCDGSGEIDYEEFEGVIRRHIFVKFCKHLNIQDLVNCKPIPYDFVWVQNFRELSTLLEINYWRPSQVVPQGDRCM